MFSPNGRTCFALVLAAALAACTSQPQTTPAPPPSGAATAISLASVAGNWNMRAVPTTGDTTATTYVMTATANTSGWLIRFPNRDPIPMTVTVAGDSIITHAGPYQSVRRAGVQVTTDARFHLQGGNLVGQTVAHYQVTTADSVLTLTTTGSRAP